MRRRLSVSLLVPQPAETEVQGLRRALGDPTLGRYVPHITLVPPVNVNETRLEDALRLVREVAAKHTSLQLIIGPPGTFLPENPVTFLRVAGDPLEAMQRQMSVDPFELEHTRPFVPHVTIGRNETDITSLLSSYMKDVEIDRIHVMQREDDGSWFPIADVPFGTPIIVGRGGVELEMTVSRLADPTTVRLVGRLKSDLVVTARRRGETIGVAVATVDGTHANLDALIVAANQRHQGIGSQLLAHFIHAARSSGIQEIMTECTKADGLFEARGFKRVSGVEQPVLKLPI